jgi:hypothetical protein
VNNAAALAAGSVADTHHVAEPQIDGFAEQAPGSPEGHLVTVGREE